MKIGDKIPEILGINAEGAEVKASDFAGKKLAIYFYPKDNTSACTMEARDFTAAVPQFEALNAKVIGVSRDSVKTHEGFCTRQELGIELVSDKSEELCTAFDVIKPKVMYGKPCRGIVRSTFLIDPQGRLAFEWRGVKVPGHVEAVLEKIRELS